MPTRRHLALFTAAVTGAATLATGAAAAQASTAKVSIPDTLPRWVKTAAPAARPNALRAAPAAMTATVYLAPQGGTAALQAKVASLSDPSSPEYRHWLTSAQYAAQFAPTAAQVRTVSSWARSQGLTVSAVDAHKRFVTVSGTQNQLSTAFSVSLGTFDHAGQTVLAPTTPVSLPADVAASVLTVTGLDTTVVLAKHHAVADVTPPPGYVNAKPCNIDYGTVKATYQADYRTPLPAFQGKTLPYAVCGYTGPSLRAAYENNTTLDGTGVTVAITDAYSWQLIASDAATYAANHGDAGYSRNQLTLSTPSHYTNQAACDPSGWSGEETLDVEAVHAMAGGAKIKYYAGASCADKDLLDAIARAVDDNQAKVVTNSWGEAEEAEDQAAVAAYEQVLLQGAAQGQSFLWSSGDSGDELQNTGIKQTDYPAADPYVTAVGGTSTAIAGGVITGQTGWGTEKYTLSKDGRSWVPVGFVYGAGGGYSSLFNRPAYQNGVVPATAPAGRAVPDVAMDADPTTGMLIGQTQTFPDSVHYGEYRIGGTSLASPLFAGMAALAIQNNNGVGFGLMNPTLYKAPAGTFTDVTNATLKDKGNVRVDYANGNDPSGGLLYSVRTFGQDSSLALAKGWDPVTGLGVPTTALFGVKPGTTTATVAPGSRASGPGAHTPVN